MITISSNREFFNRDIEAYTPSKLRLNTYQMETSFRCETLDSKFLDFVQDSILPRLGPLFRDVQINDDCLFNFMRLNHPNANISFTIGNTILLFDLSPETIIHEILHVLQRMFPKSFHKLYLSWGFQLHDINDLMDRMQKFQWSSEWLLYNNPDGQLDTSYTYDNILPVYAHRQMTICYIYPDGTYTTEPIKISISHRSRNIACLLDQPNEVLAYNYEALFEDP